MSRRRAFTLVEVMVAVALGAFIALITGSALINASRVFTKNSSRDAAFRELAKARRSLETDLIQVSLNSSTIVQAPASLGGGADGDAIDYLSAVNVTSGKIVPQTDGSGSPYFYQNLIYYITVPSDHDTLFATTCTGGNEGGYDYNCPHKELIRMVQDENPTFDPGDSTSQDNLLPSLLTFLTRPAGFPLTSNFRAVAINLVSFRINRLPGELEVDLRAAAILDARRKISLGTTSLRTGPYTIQQRFSIFPKN